MIGCKAHKKKDKSIKAVVTSLKLNTNKVLKEIRFCLKFFSLPFSGSFCCCCFGFGFFLSKLAIYFDWEKNFMCLQGNG